MTIPSGTELARTFLPAKDFTVSAAFYEALGFAKVLDDGEVGIFTVRTSYAHHRKRRVTRSATAVKPLDDGETMRGRRRLLVSAQVLWCWTNVNTKGA